MIDRLVIKPGIEARLADSLQTALELADGNAVADIIDGDEIKFSEHHACPICGFSVDQLEPRMFSFNNPFGACPSCDGLGSKLTVDIDLVVPDKTLSLNEGAILPWQPISSNYYPTLLKQACEHFNIDMDKPFNKLTKKEKNIVLRGHDDEIEFKFNQDYGVKTERKRTMAFEGVLNNIERRYHDSPSEYVREVMQKYMVEKLVKHVMVIV